MDSRIPSRDDCVLSAMLEKRAKELTDKPFAIFESGESWSYKHLADEAKSTAAALAEIGVRRNDPVLVWLPSDLTHLKLIFALSYLGAIFVPINLAFKGNSLEHLITNSGASLIICHAQLVERLNSVNLGSLATIIVVGGQVGNVSSLRVLPESVLTSNAPFPSANVDVEPWDTCAIMYTSGTTGPSKGALCSHLHIFTLAAQIFRHFNSEDRVLSAMPLFHMGGLLVPFGVLYCGASMAMVANFRTQEFWDRARQFGATTSLVVGAMAEFLLKQPLGDDRNHPMRLMLQQPLVSDVPTFSRRFGVQLFTMLDMTEMPAAIASGLLSSDKRITHGYVGRLRSNSPTMEVRVVDDFDREVGTDQVGQLIVRCETPWVISTGYHRMPAATEDAWRNGWFHTGDLVRRDAEGNFYFVDRAKDSIRRRGENISSAELELEVLAHDKVEAVAAIAVQSEDGEDDALIVIETKAGQKLEPSDLLHFLMPRIPHFMVPRYIRVVDKIPKTPTDKVQKSVLRSEGITVDTWDREKAGIKVRREKIGS